MSVKSTTDSANVKRKTPAYIMIFIMIFVLFGFQEILFRLIFPIPEVTNFNRINYSPVFFGETETSLKYLSNASFIWASDPDKTESLVNLNLYGFRTHDFSIEPDPEKKRIVFIGDSFTEGFLAADDETIPVAFENKAIEKGKDYEVLNLGIGGTDFTYYYKLLAGQMPVLKPDHVIMVLHGNDLPPIAYTQEYFDNPLVPEFSSKWVPRIYYVVKNYLDDKTVPKIWRSSPFIFFAPVPAPSNPWSNEVKTKEFEKLLSKNVVDAMKIGRFNPYAYEEYSMLKKRLPEDFKITDHLNGIQNFVEQFGNKV